MLIIPNTLLMFTVFLVPIEPEPGGVCTVCETGAALTYRRHANRHQTPNPDSHSYPLTAPLLFRLTWRPYLHARHLHYANHIHCAHDHTKPESGGTCTFCGTQVALTYREGVQPPPQSPPTTSAPDAAAAARAAAAGAGGGGGAAAAGVITRAGVGVDDAQKAAIDFKNRLVDYDRCGMTVC